MPYYERRIQSGKLLEVEVYFASRCGRRNSRSPNMGETPEDQERINERNAQKRLRRLILSNFSSDKGDLFVTYTYRQPVTEEQATKGERNLLARLRRLRAKKGLPELKYIVITECQGNWHHHIIMNGGLTLEDVRRVWGDRGARIQLSTLDDTGVCEGLARYLTQQHKTKRGGQTEDNAKQPRRKGQRRWHASRNLAEPTVKLRRLGRLPKGEPKARKGYRLLPDWTVGCDAMGYIYRYCSYILDAPKARENDAASSRERAESRRRRKPRCL